MVMSRCMMGAAPVMSRENSILVQWKVSLLILLILTTQVHGTDATSSKLQSADYFSLSARDIDGNSINFSELKGMVSLVVNTASMCGFTESHLRDLTRLHHILANTGHFQVLAFPCNQFGEQEPGDPSQIKQYVLVNYESEFLLMDKVNVTGEHAHPVFKYVAAGSSVTPDWNFYKYLVDHNGRVLGVWGPRISISDIFSQVQAAVTAAERAAQTQEDTPVKPNTETDQEEAKEEVVGPAIPGKAAREEL